MICMRRRKRLAARASSRRSATSPSAARTGSRPRSARSAAGSSARGATCRSRSRPRGRASRPRGSSRSTPSTALTVAGRAPRRKPRRIGKCLRRPRDLQQDVVRQHRARSSTHVGGAASTRPGGRPARLRAQRGHARAADRSSACGAARCEGAAGRHGARSAAAPGSLDRREPLGRRAPVESTGRSAAGHACRDAAGRRRDRATGALSTILPAIHHDHMRRPCSATTPRSWVMTGSRVPSRAADRSSDRGSAPGW